MKIGIDARFVGPQGTGLGKYTEKLIENLAKVDQTNDYVIFLQRNNWDFLTLGKNFKKILVDIPWYSISEQIKLPNIYKNQNLDLLHVPHFNVSIFYKGKFIVTIHDLIHHQFSEHATTTNNPIVFKIKRFAYRKVIAHAIKKSSKILTPSNFVKGEIVKTFNVDQLKIAVTYEAAEEEYFSSKRSTINDKQLTLLYVGNAYPHKNLNTLLDAFKILSERYSRSVPGSIKAHSGSETRLKLIIVCPRDVFSQRLAKEIQARHLQKHIELKGYMAPEELSKLFRKANVYVFPSLSEGFGIPGLNAMAASLPVVCSNIPTLKEIYSDAALYFDPKNPEDIAAKVNQVITDSDLRFELAKKGREQVKKYSWLQMAKETLEVYIRSLDIPPI